MLAKIVYNLSTKQVKSASWGTNIDAIFPDYTPQTEAVAKLNIPEELPNMPSRYFFIDPTVVKDYYGSLELTSDQTDTDGDGIEDMPSDGTTLATYTVKKKDKDGNYVTGAGDTDLISIQADRGKLSSRSKSLVAGETTFTLKSIEETVLITVTISNPVLGVQSKLLQLRP